MRSHGRWFAARNGHQHGVASRGKTRGDAQRVLAAAPVARCNRTAHTQRAFTQRTKQLENRRAAVGRKESRNGPAFDLARSGAEQFGSGTIAFKDLAIEPDHQIPHRREVV